MEGNSVDKVVIITRRGAPVASKTAKIQVGILAAAMTCFRVVSSPTMGMLRCSFFNGRCFGSFDGSLTKSMKGLPLSPYGSAARSDS